MSEQEQAAAATPHGGASVLTGGLGIEVAGSVMLELKSEPNQVSAMDFTSLRFGDGRMVITFSGGDKTYRLSDVKKVTIRPSVTQQERSNADYKDAKVSR